MTASRVRYSRGRWVNLYACGYCWAEFEPKRVDQVCCSPECAKRNGEWNAWLNATRSARSAKDAGRALPFGKAAVTAVARFALVDPNQLRMVG